MDVTTVEPDILRVRGAAGDSGATLYFSGGSGVLVDALGSRDDAMALRQLVANDLRARVRFVIATHYTSDSMAALATFPEALVIAHRDHRHAFDHERGRSDEGRGFYVAPSIEVASDMVLHWGRFSFDIFANPGHSVGTLNVEVPEADALQVGDNVLGNIVDLAYASPPLLRRALSLLLRRRRARVMGSHGGVLGSQVLENACFYLDRILRRARQAAWAESPAEAISRIPLAECMAPNVEPTPMERGVHERNLKAIVERRLFETL